jgi:hypothetical protein
MNSHRLTRFRWEFIRWGGTACCAGRVQPTALSGRFSTLSYAERRRHVHRGPRRAAADASRWAGGFLGLLLQFGSSALAASCSAQEPPCQTPTARHLRSSARRGCPASERCLFTRVAYAPPSRGLALRLCLHGSSRLSYLRVRPCICTAKVAALDACRPKDATPAAPPNTCCSRPPSRCVFPSQRVPTILLLHTRVLVGRPAELLRWAAQQCPSHYRPCALVLTASHLTDVV